MAQQFSHYANNIRLKKYSHPLPGGGRETWEQTAHRVASCVFRSVSPPPTYARTVEQMIAEREFMPGGRYLASTGRDFHQTQNCFSGDTRFITPQGIFHLRMLAGQKVTVLNKDGEWEEAEVRQFGHQEIWELHTSHGHVIHTTKDHLWWQKDGSRITSDRVQEIPFTKVKEFPAPDEEGIRHGIVYGDGHLVKNRYAQIVFVNRLKGTELLKYFKKETKEVRVNFGGILRVETIRWTARGWVVSLLPSTYKELPSEVCTPSYARGFIAGLIATDGCTSNCGSVTITCEGFSEAFRISSLATLAGCVVNSVKITSRTSPFDGSDRELCTISIKPWSAPILRPYHAEKMSKNPRTNFRDTVQVTSRIATGRFEDVYCVVAPKTQSFTLANGLTTSNCLLLRAQDSREGWSELAYKCFQALMTGAGIGVVYSGVRAKGKLIRRTGGSATGPIALMQIINDGGRQIRQGGERRSAIWAGLHWWHEDIFDFIEVKNWSPEVKKLKAANYSFPATLDGTNISVILDREFFDAYDDEFHPKHKLAHQVYWRTVKQMVSTAEPGFSIDYDDPEECLRNAPIHGATKVLTSFGYQTVHDIVGSPTRLFTGKQWAVGTFQMTGSMVPVVEVVMSHDGIVCDPSHEFILLDGTRVPAGKLKPGMKLATFGPVESQVVSVEPCGKADVYCCDVGVEEHSFVAEGVIISNCTEVSSSTTDDICNLGSINMAKVRDLDHFRQLVHFGCAFLLAGTVYSHVPYPQVDQVRSKNRRLGLGLMGLHEWLIKRGKKYGPDAELEEYLRVYAKSTDEACGIADMMELSHPVKTRAIAPTGTIGIVAETTTGIEPIFSVAHKRRYLKTQDVFSWEYVIDPTARRLIEQGIDPESIEDAYSISYERRIEFQAWVQQYVDHGISSTINTPRWGSPQINEGNYREFGEVLYRYLPRLRGITCYPDGAREGQPMTAVPYLEAARATGIVHEEQGDVCTIKGGGSCGE